MEIFPKYEWEYNHIDPSIALPKKKKDFENRYMKLLALKL
jgi:hypothetical protein